MKRTLGTQIRHLIDLLDSGVESVYIERGLNYKPRYTPVMKAIANFSPCTINDIADHAGITQPAATQTVKVMVDNNLIEMKRSDSDARKKYLTFTGYGKEVLKEVEKCWSATDLAADLLNKELEMPLSTIVAQAISALEAKPMSQRITEASQITIKNIKTNEGEEI